MKRRSGLAAACSSFALLAACSGGGGGIASTPAPTPTPAPAPAPTPSPTPSPTSSPTPTPTPAPSPAPSPPRQPTSFPLNSSDSFNTTRSRQEYHIDAISGAYTGDGQGTEGIGSSLRISYDARAKGYTVTSSEASSTFDKSDLTSTDNGFLNYSAQSGSVSDNLSIYDGTTDIPADGRGPLRLTYLSLGIWTHTDSSSGQNLTNYFLFGFPTAQSSMPISGTASYSTLVKASYVDLADRAAGDLGGTATFGVDFGAGTVNTTLALQYQNGTPFGLYNYIGTGTISEYEFMGTFSSANPEFASGGFLGNFYGPNAKEMGYTFWLDTDWRLGDPYAGASLRRNQYWITGAVLGRKN